MSDYSEDDDSPLIKKAKPTVRPQKVFAHYPIFADDDAIFATSRVAESICQNIRTAAAAAKAIDENFKRTERILIGGLASVNQIVENFRQNTSNITNLIRQYESPFGDFLKTYLPSILRDHLHTRLLRN